MIWFLRLFPQFRVLESECQILRKSAQDSATQALLLQDRLDATLQDRSKLWDLMQESVRCERATYQAHINAQWQKEGRPAPYPEAPQLAPHAVPQPQLDQVIPRTLTPSEAIRRKTNDFIRSYVEQHRTES